MSSKVAPFRVEPICSLLQVAPSTYYAAKDRGPSARAVSDATLTPELVTLWETNYSVYGVRKLWKAARRAGHDIGRDQTGRLMRAAGIEGATRTKRVKTTRPDPMSSRHPDLVKREFTVTAPNRLLGHGPHVRPDLGGRRLCVLHHRRVLADDRGVAVRVTHAHRDGPRRDRDGPLGSRCSPRRSSLPQRCRQSIHVDSLRRTPRRDRSHAVDWNRRRQL